MVMPHPESDRLRQAIERCASRAVQWSGGGLSIGVAAIREQGRSPDGHGQQTAGARWNPPKSFPTVYSSLDPHTALDEVLAHYRYFSIPIESAMPRVESRSECDLPECSTSITARHAPRSEFPSVGCSKSLGEKSRRRVARRSRRPGSRRPRTGLGGAPRPFCRAAGRDQPHRLPRRIFLVAMRCRSSTSGTYRLEPEA